MKLYSGDIKEDTAGSVKDNMKSFRLPRKDVWRRTNRERSQGSNWLRVVDYVSFLLHIKYTNDSVRSQTKLTDLPVIIADRRHSLLGHVYRLPPDVPAHNILQHCVNLSQGRCPAPDWKRPPGWPRKTWMHM